MIHSIQFKILNQAVGASVGHTHLLFTHKKSQKFPYFYEVNIPILARVWV